MILDVIAYKPDAHDGTEIILVFTTGKKSYVVHSLEEEKKKIIVIGLGDDSDKVDVVSRLETIIHEMMHAFGYGEEKVRAYTEKIMKYARMYIEKNVEVVE